MGFRCVYRILVTAVFLIFHAQIALADLPTKLRTTIEKSIEEYEKATKEAGDKMLGAFDATTDAIRNSPRIEPESKQSMIESIAAEKTAFSSSGRLPFSLAMRQSTVRYLAAIEKARLIAGRSYDLAIAHFQRKDKDDLAASRMADEKKKLLAPRVIGQWQCVGQNFSGSFTWPLKSDGTIGDDGNTWRFEGDNLVFRVGAHIDTCTIGATGKTLTARNQSGGAYTATLIDP